MAFSNESSVEAKTCLQAIVSAVFTRMSALDSALICGLKNLSLFSGCFGD
jgi:hypothetical protein